MKVQATACRAFGGPTASAIHLQYLHNARRRPNTERERESAASSFARKHWRVALLLLPMRRARNRTASVRMRHTRTGLRLVSASKNTTFNS